MQNTRRLLNYCFLAVSLAGIVMLIANWVFYSFDGGIERERIHVFGFSPADRFYRRLGIYILGVGLSGIILMMGESKPIFSLRRAIIILLMWTLIHFIALH